MLYQSREKKLRNKFQTIVYESLMISNGSIIVESTFRHAKLRLIVRFRVRYDS